MSKMKAVLFDLGNVLVRIDMGMFGRSLGFEDAQEMAPNVPELMAWARRYEMGDFGTDMFLAGLQNILGSAYSIHHLREAFQRIICEPIEGMEEVVGRMGDLYQTALVSNTNEIHHLTSIATVPALALLPKHYVSYQLKALKPDERFYRAILADLALPAEDVVFIDDLQENVKGAQRAGMIGVLFAGVEALRRELDRLQEST